MSGSTRAQVRTRACPRARGVAAAARRRRDSVPAWVNRGLRAARRAASGSRCGRARTCWSAGRSTTRRSCARSRRRPTARRRASRRRRLPRPVDPSGARRRGLGRGARLDAAVDGHEDGAVGRERAPPSSTSRAARTPTSTRASTRRAWRARGCRRSRRRGSSAATEHAVAWTIVAFPTERWAAEIARRARRRAAVAGRRARDAPRRARPGGVLERAPRRARGPRAGAHGAALRQRSATAAPGPSSRSA